MTTNRTDLPGLTTVASLWPNQGRRNAAYLALAGALLRSGWPWEKVEEYFLALTDARNDSDSRTGIARATAERLKIGQPTSGWPTLAEILPESRPAVAKIKHALGLCATLAELANKKRLSLDFLQAEGLHDLEDGGIGIPYKDAGGKTLAVKTRMTLESNSYRWPKGERVLAYGEHRLNDAAAAGYLILCEGETDPLTLWNHNEPALGLPGADTVNRTLQTGHVANRSKLFVFQEPDQGGETFVDAVRQRLAALGWTGDLSRVSLDNLKDPSDLHCDSPETFKERWKKAMEDADPLDLPLPARVLWREVYGELSADRPGLVGAMVARAEAHVLRLSLLYALLDRSCTIQVTPLDGRTGLLGLLRTIGGLHFRRFDRR